MITRREAQRYARAVGDLIPIYFDEVGRPRPAMTVSSPRRRSSATSVVEGSSRRPS